MASRVRFRDGRVIIAQRFAASLVVDGMTSAAHHPEQTRRDGYVVRSPRATDTIGHTLRGVFGECVVPDDMKRLLSQLDRVRH